MNRMIPKPSYQQYKQSYNTRASC